jgi:hypothetical protein
MNRLVFFILKTAGQKGIIAGKAVKIKSGPLKTVCD